MSTRDDLAKKGEREPTAGLVEQAGKSLETGKQFKEQLKTYGFGEDKLAEMEAKTSEVASSVGAREASMTSSKSATGEQSAAVAAIKEYFARLNLIAPVVVREAKPQGIGPNVFAPNGRLGDSPKKLIDHADKTRPAVERLNEHLTKYFAGQSPLALHDKLRADLNAANSKQENMREDRPQKTVDLNAAKGRLLELIDEMNRVGRLAFMGQATMAARFNKDILLRARRRTGKSTSTTDTPTPGTPEGPVSPD